MNKNSKQDIQLLPQHLRMTAKLSLLITIFMAVILQRYDLGVLFFCFTAVAYALIAWTRDSSHPLHSLKGFVFLGVGFLVAILISHIMVWSVLFFMPVSSSCGKVMQLDSKVINKGSNTLMIVSGTEQRMFDYQPTLGLNIQVNQSICIDYKDAPKWQLYPVVLNIRANH